MSNRMPKILTSPTKNAREVVNPHATIIYEEITNLYEQPHAKNIDVTHKERP